MKHPVFITELTSLVLNKIFKFQEINQYNYYLNNSLQNTKSYMPTEEKTSVTIDETSEFNSFTSNMLTIAERFYPHQQKPHTVQLWDL